MKLGRYCTKVVDGAHQLVRAMNPVMTATHAFVTDATRQLLDQMLADLNENLVWHAGFDTLHDTMPSMDRCFLCEDVANVELEVVSLWNSRGLNIAYDLGRAILSTRGGWW